jgi:large subunit ribosomal protein L6
LFEDPTMSRIGKKSIDLPKGVTATVSGRTVTVKGAKHSLTIEHRPEVKVAVAGDKVSVTREGDDKHARAYHGLTRALISNMVDGVTKGFRKELEIVGVGWTARVQGKKIALSVGYADTREVEIPAGVTVEVNQTRIAVSGPDKQAVGQLAAAIRAERKPEPYNGKGIKYVDEVIIRKEGKAFAGGA